MTSPQKPAGDMALADVNVKMGMDILTGALGVYGADNEKGRTLLDVLKKLSSTFGVDASKHADAVPAEVKAQLAALQGTPGGPPGSPIVGGPPLPAGAPPGA